MRAGQPKECSGCGCVRTIIVDASKIREQRMLADKVRPHSKYKALYWTQLVLQPLCVPCFLKTISFPMKWDAIPSMFKECVGETTDE